LKPSYVSVNEVQSKRLTALLARLTDEDLARRLPSGPSVANVLVHLAFWDVYACQVLREWKCSGFSGSRTHFEAVNSAVLTLAEQIPDRNTVAMVLSAAEAVDLEAASVSAELAGTIVDNGKLRTLERGQHRGEHLDQIEALLCAG
jgi:hypothetical protein